MKAALLFPPIVDPRAPHLAQAALAAFLRQGGIDVSLFDLDCAAFHFLLRRDRLEDALARLARAPADPSRDKAQRARLQRLGEHLLEHASQAPATLRDPELFFDAHAYAGARDLIASALALHAEAASIPLDVGIFPIRYAVEGADPQRLADLVRVTGLREANLYADQWEEELFPALASSRPDLVGISIANGQQMLPGLLLARELRSRGHFVVIGGTVFAKFPQQLLHLPEFFDRFADGVVISEGETALAELLAQLAGGRDFSRVPNFLFRSGGRVVMTRQHIEDPDALPTPDFTGLPLGDYLAPAPVLPILAGKGCYHNRCRFCGIPSINRVGRRPYRRRSVEKIVGDIATLAARFGCRHFVFTDEAMAPKLLLDLAGAIEASAQRDLSFTAYARLEPGFTPEACRRIAGMGMRKLFFGLESASQRTLDHMRKGTAAANAPGILRNCRDAGIRFHLFSIVGFPEEGEQEARATYAFFRDNRDVIDHPGNSFDLHPLGLELRSDYFRCAEELGIRVAPSAAEKEFVITLPPQDWSNERGLSRARVQELIDREFAPGLRETFSRSHHIRTELWPGAEEYAALYGAFYRGRDFPFGTALPEEGDGRRFHLSWNPAVLVEEEADGRRRLTRFNITVRVSRALADALAGERFRCMDERFRKHISTLILEGILQLRWDR